MRGDKICPICGEVVEDPLAVAGWVICAEHESTYVKPSKFDSRCTYCGGKIAEGQMCVMHKAERWIVLHSAFDCEMQQSVKCSSPYYCLYLTDNAPREIVDSAYRTLAKIHHPDHGGDAEQMKIFSAAYNEICGK